MLRGSSHSRGIDFFRHTSVAFTSRCIRPREMLSGLEILLELICPEIRRKSLHQACKILVGFQLQLMPELSPKSDS